MTRRRKSELARALSEIETKPDIAALDEAYRTMSAHLVGLTGPPGVGKSTLLGALIPRWRASGRSVGVIAVDPSSRRTGGALLGDRARLKTDPEDDGVFVRSMAARDRLGGLSPQCFAASMLMGACFDIVLVETVGVGQSETDIAGLADTVVFCIQPGAGDGLQFMKAGIVEIPHICVVTKSDLGAPAQAALADAKTAIDAPILPVSATTGEGLDALLAAIDRNAPAQPNDPERRRRRAEHWLADAIRLRFGTEGLRRAGSLLQLNGDEGPFSREAEIAALLMR